ncbi:hypothetical protein, partial [Caldisphaera sp.]|uniref:hypothetical protein n=1 Tax=Caldisphaera sp. TaxID=2060322 RepID=UPI00397B0DC1
LGLIIRSYESNSVFTDVILDMKTTLDNIYSSLGQFIGSPQDITNPDNGIVELKDLAKNFLMYGN